MKKIFADEGTVEFSNNNLLILSSTVKDLKNFDKNSISGALKDAEKNFKKPICLIKSNILLLIK